MTDYTELVEALRETATFTKFDDLLSKREQKLESLAFDAAAAIETLNRLLDQNTKRCEELRKQLREAQEQYEKHLNELEQQLPKRGEWVHGKELGRAYIGDCCVGIVYEDFRCSACGVVIEECEKPKWNYCPNCGAKMEAQE